MSTQTPASLEAALIARLRANQLHIPSYPAVATKLQELVNKGRRTDELAAVAANDPPLVAALLANASSAAHGAATAPTSLSAAIQRLGMQELVRLALAASLGSVATAPGPLAGLRRDTWRCALLSARLCHDLAARRGVDAEEAYLAGVLHDFGAIAVVAGLEESAKQAPLPTLPEITWRAIVSRLHVPFGAAIAMRWKLPPSIAAVIASYGQPAEMPKSALVQLVQLVDRVIEKLDRAPTTGIAALLELKELSTDERYAIGAALPDVVAQMAAYTSSTPTAAAAPSKVEAAKREEEAWPVSFGVTQSGSLEVMQARTISPSTFELVAKQPLTPNWLADMTLECEPAAIKMLVNVKSCVPAGDGTYLVVMQPFALAGPVKQQWTALLEQARLVLEEVA
jgi:HD-like signal output (HDOD) protein